MAATAAAAEGERSQAMVADFDEYEYLEKEVEATKEKEHRSSRHGEKGDGGDGKERSSRSERRERDREPRSGGDREKDRGREREHRDKDRERERERERARDRERDRGGREREQEFYRERSGSHGRSMREAAREMERARSRESREREFERESRESRRFKDKKEMEPEVDPERDQRTVFAYQMPLKATERDVYEFFSQVGKVRDVRLIMDRNSRRSKGVGYIEFYDAMSVPAAIAISGHQLLGQPVMVKPSEAEKNLVQSTSTGGTGVAGATALRKLYVGNLHFSISEEQLRQIFEPFGPVELVQLPSDLETGQCRGYGFVQFAQLEHAKAAQSLNGNLDIAGRVIKVSAVTDHVGVQDTGANAADFDVEDGGALSLNARSRAILMQKLDRTGTATSISESLGVPGLNGGAPNQLGVALPVNGQAAVPPVAAIRPPPVIAEPVGEPTECLLLKNMFDPATETEPDFEMDIKDDVQEECSKFGPLQHIYVDKDSNGFVYLRFQTVAAASGCQRAMHGRWFAGRAISTVFMSLHEYEANVRGGM